MAEWGPEKYREIMEKEYLGHALPDGPVPAATDMPAVFRQKALYRQIHDRQARYNVRCTGKNPAFIAGFMHLTADRGWKAGWAADKVRADCRTHRS